MSKGDIKPFQILLVEDEPADAHLVRISLRESRVYSQLHHVRDGVEALDFLRREGEGFEDAPVPDLILLDLNMPRMNGLEFLAEVKKEENLRQIPVVILTTSSVERDVTASYHTGASGYIVKPMDMDQFSAAIRQLEQYWFALVQLPREARIGQSSGKTSCLER